MDLQADYPCPDGTGGPAAARGDRSADRLEAQLPGESLDIGENLLLRLVRGAVDQLVHAELAAHLDLLRDRLAVEHHEEGLALASGLPPQSAQPSDAARDVLRDRCGHPPVGAPTDPPEVLLVPRRADQGSRSGGPCGLGPRPAGAEVHELTVVLGLVLTPQRAHGLEVLAQHGPAAAGRHTMIRHLVEVPAVAHAEDGP